MNEIFTNETLAMIMQILIPVLATAIGTVITALAVRYAALLKDRAALIAEKKTGEKVIRYIDILEKTVVDVVQGLNQTTVQALKEAAADGKLTTEEIERISAEAKETIIAIIGPAGIDVLNTAFADLKELIACKIERVVLEVKEQKAA